MVVVCVCDVVVDEEQGRVLFLMLLRGEVGGGARFIYTFNLFGGL